MGTSLKRKKLGGYSGFSFKLHHFWENNSSSSGLVFAQLNALFYAYVCLYLVGVSGSNPLAGDMVPVCFWPCLNPKNPLVKKQLDLEFIHELILAVL